jgi:hypothetical protein
MRVDVTMGDEKKLHVSGWYATQPEYVLKFLGEQLEAAKAIWPELNSYRIGASATADRARRGSLGGVARAAALSPEQRKEMASNAAKARWTKPAA